MAGRLLSIFGKLLVIMIYIDNSGLPFCITQVKWAKDTIDECLNFYSVSEDGKVINWTIIKSALISGDAINIPFCERETIENFNRLEAKRTWKGANHFCT